MPKAPHSSCTSTTPRSSATSSAHPRTISARMLEPLLATNQLKKGGPTMGDDTCSVILRIWHEDSLAVAHAFRENPDATENLDDDDSGLLRLLVYEETVPDPLRRLVEQ